MCVCVTEGKAIPTELRLQAESLKHDIDLEHAGMAAPKVCVCLYGRVCVHMRACMCVWSVCALCCESTGACS